jgi:LacI family transcriptional regulator
VSESALKAIRPTILDVAERAGVSAGTVSNVLNGSVRVSGRRRQRVLDAIEELSFTPNPLAQGLRQRRTPVVGVCVPHTSVAYFSKLVDAFEEVASSRGFEIMQIVSHDNPRIEQKRVTSLLNYRVGGIILVPTARSDKTLDAITRSGTPLVIVDRPVAQGRFDQVTFNNRDAMRQAAHGLIALGHRRIMFVVRRRALATTRQRVAALRATVRAAANNGVTTILECDSYDPAAITIRLAEALRGRDTPTAIIVSNSMFAACIFRVFESLGVRCPDDVSLLAFDQPEWADVVTPKLSVVRQPTIEIARKAWEFLIRRMDDEMAPVQIAELQADLLLSESVAPVHIGISGTRSTVTPVGALGRTASTEVVPGIRTGD